MNRYLAGMLIASASAGALAQSAAPATDHPKAIGVSQSTADEANQKAVQNGNTATVVRTGPSAADKASDAMSSTKHETTKAKRKVKTMTNTDAETNKP
ncbi:MAG: hypothetical protein ABI277_13005 [Burkholderiaceae bacterium]